MPTPPECPSALLTDLYELTMIDAYLADGMTAPASFELFVRKLPPNRSFLMAAGLQQVVEFLKYLRVTAEEIEWLRGLNRFSGRLLNWLAELRFTGDLDAVAEGTIVFQDEPLLRVTAPLPLAQFLESRLMNILHFQTVVASKAARSVLAAEGRTLVDFGLRRAHGAEAGLMAARAAYLAGFAGTATVLAGFRFGIPVVGTMAHSFVQAYGSEAAAFASFVRAHPRDAVLLIDTYDTLQGARTAVQVARDLPRGAAIGGVRLDSGDLDALSRQVRAILDAGGLDATRIIASGGLDEGAVDRLVRAGAPIDGFGIGTSLTTASDAPALDCAYKLVAYDGRPCRKRSAGKATWPGAKQVWRHHDGQGRISSDLLCLAEERSDGVPLLAAILRGGRRVGPLPTLGQARMNAAAALSSLPDDLRDLSGTVEFRPVVSPALLDLTADTDRRLDAMLAGTGRWEQGR